MLKALLRKQWIGITAFFKQGKDGKARKPMLVAGLIFLVLYAVGAGGVMFWLMADYLCLAFVQMGLDWAYFALFGLLATGFGVIGGVFMAKSKLYEAKDNEMLFAMPIPSWMILFSRMLGLYVFTLLFEALVFLPALAQYLIIVGFSAKVLLLGIVLQFLMPFGALALCCLLGFLVALLTAKMPFKNLLTIVFFLAFFVAYMAVYSKINLFMEYLLSNGEAVGNLMANAFYPFGQLGRAAMGDWVAFLIFLAIFIGLFALVYAVMSATYFRVATMKTGERRPRYVEKTAKNGSMFFALLKKEFLRFIKSPAYFLNTAMGSLLMLIVFVMMLIKNDLFGITPEMLGSIPELQKATPLLLVAICCFMGVSNTISASSISLEGDSIWVLQSLPVEEKKIFNAKISLHFIMTAIPTIFCVIAFGLMLEVSVWYILFSAMIMMAFVALCSVFGLVINLKMPNLHWTNETAAVKQSMSTLVAMLGGWGFVLLPVGLYFAFGKYMPIWSYMLLWLAVFSVAAVALLTWLYKRGGAVFAKLK